jgi:hypothetical protein
MLPWWSAVADVSNAPERLIALLWIATIVIAMAGCSGGFLLWRTSCAILI